MRITIPESLPKVFKLSTPMHLLAKLRWEIAAFKRSQNSKSHFAAILPSYHAFNCAVTAWHITDWSWDYDPDSQADIAVKLGLKNSDLRSFQDAIAQRSRALNACREIANGSKHRRVTRRRADPFVTAHEEWAEIKLDRDGNARYGAVWLISDKHGTRPALDVFNEAADYWYEFLAPWMEDRFVGTARRGRRNLSGAFP